MDPVRSTIDLLRAVCANRRRDFGAEFAIFSRFIHPSTTDSIRILPSSRQILEKVTRVSRDGRVSYIYVSRSIGLLKAYPRLPRLKRIETGYVGTEFAIAGSLRF